MKKQSETATGLKELIKHAISDHVITPDEYRQIMECAQDDGHLDKEERALLAQFHEMLSSGVIERGRG